MESFSYESIPLGANEIRVFTLMPSPDLSTFSPLKIKLATFSLDELPQFHALSYHWGPPSSQERERRDIYVDEKRLRISTSLLRALEALRSTNEEIALWADQISINQENADEKSKQLPHVATIYSKSEQTIAWMGNGSATSNLAIASLSTIGGEAVGLGISQVNHHQYRQLTMDDDDVQEGPNLIDAETAVLRRRIRSYVIDKGDVTKLPGLSAINKLCELEYFVRGWIREEIALSKKILFRCGDASIDGETFSAAVLLLEIFINQQLGMLKRSPWRKENEDMFTQTYQNTSAIIRFVQPSIGVRRQYQSNPGSRFFNTAYILRKFRQLSFSENRDRVYGIRGLVNDWEQLGIPFRYSRSVTWQQIFADTTKRIVQKDVEADDWQGGCNFLSFCGLKPPLTRDAPPPQSSNGNEDLPSWVPRLHEWGYRPAPTQENNSEDIITDTKNKSVSTMTIAEETRNFSSKPFNASGGLRHPIANERQHGIDLNRLLCSIIAVDRISKTGRLWVEGAILFLSDVQTFALESRKMVTSDASSIHPLRNEPNRLSTAASRVPVLDHEFLSNPTAQRRATDFSIEGWYACTGLDKKTARKIDQRELKRQNYMDNLRPSMTRRSFLGEKGFIGLGPTAARPGDTVCVIYGAAIPFVIRESPGTASAYQLVGEAYCDGIMDGEILGMGLPTQEVMLE